MNKNRLAIAAIVSFTAFSSLLGTSLITTQQAYAHGSTKSFCGRHFYNKSKHYWYVSFYTKGKGNNPGGDYNYIQIDPGKTHHFYTEKLFTATLAEVTLNFDHVRVQSYTGPNKSGTPSHNSAYGVSSRDSNVLWQTGCIYINHSGSTGKVGLNSPADGDMRFVN